VRAVRTRAAETAASPTLDFGFLAAALVLVALTVLVWRGALSYYFSQDDFAGLARARGLLPRIGGPIRWFSNQGLWDLMRPLGVASARPYHLLSLTAHAGCAVTLFAMLARRYHRAAAFLAAAFFATHPMLFTEIHWVSAIGDPLALLFALLALDRALGTRGQRWAWPWFALSLLAKESCVLLPVVVWAHQRWGARVDRLAPPRGNDTARSSWLHGPAAVLPGLWAIALIGALVMLAQANGPAVRNALTATPGSAYAFGGIGAVMANALTYVGWTVNLWLPTVRGFSDAIDRSVWPWAAGAFVLFATGLFVRPLRERGWIAAGVMYAAFLVPVLPLRNHTYHYYLAAALAGVAWGLAIAGDAVLVWAGAGRRSWAWAAVGALAATLAINGGALGRKIEMMPFAIQDLRADPTIDRARIARNVFDSIRDEPMPAGSTLVFWSPFATTAPPGSDSATLAAAPEAYATANLRTALLDGLAVRVMFPQLRSVSFSSPRAHPAEPARIALYGPSGRVKLFTVAQIDSFAALAAAVSH